LPGEIVEARHAQTPDLEDVAEALGGNEPRPGAAQLEQRVGGDGGAVKHLDHVATAETCLVEDLAEPVDDGAGVVLHAGRHLLDVQASVGVEEDDVGEGAADIDRDAEAAHAVRSIARTAAIVTGLALNVPPCGAGGGPPRVGSNTAMTSARPATAPTGKPPPMILPSVVMSGVTPKAPWAPWYPTRNEMTSSKISTMPCSRVTSRGACKNSVRAGTRPTRLGTGSTSTAPRC